MAFSRPTEINTNTCRSVIDNGSTSLYLITQNSEFKKYNINTGVQEGTTVSSIVTGAAGLTMVTNATAIIVSSTNNQVDYVNVNTGDKRSLTTNATTVYTNQTSQLVSSIPASGGIGMACRTATGGMMVVFATPQSITNQTITAMSGESARCVLGVPASSTFLVGTSNNHIHEVTPWGATLRTLSTDVTPNISAPTIAITGISFYDPYLLVATNMGFIRLYHYWTGEELDTRYIGKESSSVLASTLCASASGYTLAYTTLQGAYGLLQSVYFGAGKIFIEDEVTIEDNSGFRGVGRTDSRAYTWAQGVSFLQVRMYDIPTTATTTVDTWCQDGEVSVSARILRIRDGGYGKKFVDVDTTIPNDALTPLSAVQDRNYIELAITNTNKWDIREFKA